MTPTPEPPAECSFVPSSALLSKSRLSTDEAAGYTGVPASTLRYYRHLGTGPASYKVATRVVYDLADLDAWLEAQKAQTVRGGVQ